VQSAGTSTTDSADATADAAATFLQRQAFLLFRSTHKLQLMQQCRMHHSRGAMQNVQLYLVHPTATNTPNTANTANTATNASVLQRQAVLLFRSTYKLQIMRQRRMHRNKGNMRTIWLHLVHPLATYETGTGAQADRSTTSSVEDCVWIGGVGKKKDCEYCPD
jgi:hypothetical protein